MLASGQPPGQMGKRQEVLCGNQHGPKTVCYQEMGTSAEERTGSERGKCSESRPPCMTKPVSLQSHWSLIPARLYLGEGVAPRPDELSLFLLVSLASKPECSPATCSGLKQAAMGTAATCPEWVAKPQLSL